jgi:hypothetical protein
MLPLRSLDIGYMHHNLAMKKMFSARPIANQERDDLRLKIIQDLKYRSIDIIFPVVRGSECHQFRIRFSHGAEFQILRPPPSGSSRALLVVTLENPPEVAVKSTGAGSHSTDARTWSQDAQYYRHSNISRNLDSKHRSAISLNVPEVLVNIGRSPLTHH